MKQYFFYIIILMICILSGCANKHKHAAQLDKIAKIIENNIDSAQVLLSQVDTLNLSSSEQDIYNRLRLRIRYGNSETLLPYYDRIDRLVRSNDSDSRAYGLLYMGRYRKELGQLKEAISYCHQALNETKDNIIKITTLLELGELYRRSDNIDEALDQYKKAYSLSILIENDKKVYFSLRSIGIAYLFKENLDSASIYLYRGIDFVKTHPTLSNLKSTAYSDLSTLHRIMDEKEKALNYLSLSIALDDSVGLLQNFLSKGILLREMDQLDSARYYLILSSQSPNIYTSVTSFHKLYQIERTIGNTEKALEYNDAFFAKYDSIISQTQALEAQRLHYNYEIKERVTAEQEKSRLYIGILIIGIVILIFTGILFYQQRAKKFNEKIIGYQQDILRIRAEIEKLQEAIAEAKYKKSEIEKLQETIDETTDKKDEIEGLLHQLYPLIKEEAIAAVKLFKTSDIWARLKKNEKKKDERFSLTFDKKEVEKQLHKDFYGIIKYLKIFCPQLTQKDLDLCCLSISGLDSLTIAQYFDQVDMAAVNQRRYRIRTKISQVQTKDFLLEFPYPNN